MLSLLDSEMIIIALRPMALRPMNCLPLCTLTVHWTKNVISKLIIIIVIVM